MAIKDLIGPGFIGSDTIEFIVARGMGTGKSYVPLYFRSNHLICDQTDDELFLKGLPVTGYTFALVAVANGAAVTSGTVTVKITKDGGTQGSLTATPVHEGNAQWSINLSATEMDADIVGIAITHSSAVPQYFTLETR